LAPALPGLVDVIAPPELCTVPSRGSAVELEFDSVVLVFAASEGRPKADSISCTADETVVANEFDGAFGGAGLDVESEDDEDDTLVSESGLAKAVAGVPAMPKPTPNATAKVPTRPICPAYPIVTRLPHRCDAKSVAQKEGGRS
jgi:hypothetical protein